MVKPGCTVNKLVSSSSLDLKDLTMSDVCIVWGGSNDVGRNETIAGIRALRHFIGSHSHTNVIVFSVPQRHDLTENSCVNLEVKVFNKMLDKLKKVYQNLTVVTVDTNRDLYTRHGFHLNSQGKKHSINRVAAATIDLFRAKNMVPIVLDWDDKASMPISPAANQLYDEIVEVNGCVKMSQPLLYQNCNSLKIGNRQVSIKLSNENHAQSIQVPQEIICPNTSGDQDDSSSETNNRKSSNEDQGNQAWMVLPSKRIRRQPEKLKKDFFMVDWPLCTVSSSSRVESAQYHDLVIFHHNVQSLGNKLLELNALLSSWVLKPTILCFSEHWLLSDHFVYTNIEQYKLADKFCRNMDKHGGTCIYVLNDLKISKPTFLKNLGREKVFEISAIELVDFKILVVCIYRSPNSNVEIFLQLLDEALNKMSKRGCFLVLCGDWNINLLDENTHQKALSSLLLSNNLQNTVLCPTRVTSSSSSLIDVMIASKLFQQTSTQVVELGFSDHFALIMVVLVKSPPIFSENTIKRIFSKRSMDILNDLLKTELWDDVFLHSDVNRAYSSFLTTFLKYFLQTFPLKKYQIKEEKIQAGLRKG
jgi:exonuclease III